MYSVYKLKRDYAALDSNRLGDLIHAVKTTDARRNLIIDLRKPKSENPLSKYQTTSKEQRQNLDLVKRAFHDQRLSNALFHTLVKSIRSYLEFPLKTFRCVIEKCVITSHYNAFIDDILIENPVDSVERKIFHQSLLKFAIKQRKQKLFEWQKYFKDMEKRKQGLLLSQSSLFATVLLQTGVMLNMPRLAAVTRKSIDMQHVSRGSYDSALSPFLLPKASQDREDDRLFVSGTALFKAKQLETFWPPETSVTLKNEPRVQRFIKLGVFSSNPTTKGHLRECLCKAAACNIAIVDGYDIGHNGSLINTDYPAI